jgi:biotin operon repressor
VLKVPEATAVSPEIKVADALRQIFKAKKQYSIDQLSDQFGVGIGTIRKAVEILKSSGYVIQSINRNVGFSQTVPKSDAFRLNIDKMTTGMYKFGAVGDNHMGSRYARLDVLNALYDEFERQGVTVVFNTGNWIDGEARFNTHDLNVHGMDRQIKYFIENYPKRPGIVTKFIAGDDHEGWYTQKEGIEIGKYAEMRAREAGRTDLVYLGYMEADVVMKAPKGETIIRPVHPGGGSAYATSYTMQKLIESYQGGEKPHIVLAGHYHKAEYLYYRGVHILQTGCTQDQTPFMRKNKLAAHLGGWIFEFGTDDYGAVTRFRQEFFPFYDNGYYKKWQHQS